MPYYDDGNSGRRPAAEPEFWEPVEPDISALRSRARKLIGKRVDPEGDLAIDPDSTPRPRTLIELDQYDAIVSLGDPMHVSRRTKLRRLLPEHLALLGALDRYGCLTTRHLHRAACREMTERWTQELMSELHRAALVQWQPTQLDLRCRRGPGGSSPRLWSLTARGFRLGQESPGLQQPVIPRTRRWSRRKAETPMRLRHDLHVGGWEQAFSARIRDGVRVTQVLTPRYAEGQLAPPRMHDLQGRASRPMELRDIWLGEGYAFAEVPQGPFEHRLFPDVVMRLEIAEPLFDRDDPFRCDLLLEVDMTRRPAYNEKKLVAYDAFLSGWGLAHPRTLELGTRPVVVFTSPDWTRVRGLMRVADRVMTGRIGRLGAPAHEWYFPGREHILFTTEEEIHHGSLLACRLPRLPFDVRQALCDDRSAPTAVEILPSNLFPPAD